MICEKCKSEIADNLKFCNKCGAKIVVKSAANTQNTSHDNINATTANITTEEAPKANVDPIKPISTEKTNPMTKKCVHCGADLNVSAVFCDKCGVQQLPSDKSNHKTSAKVSNKSRVTAGLLGIFLGGFGVHNFYLGFHVKAIIQILLSVFCCGVGSIWGFIEGILILAKKINVDATGASLQ